MATGKPEYLEKPTNPGVDDGKCALCETPGVTEDNFCHGCGYHICEACDLGNPVGIHLVVAHQDEDFL